MTISIFSIVQGDLADGTISRVLALRVIDGISGWAICESPSGALWAYAPNWYALLTGEVCREV